MASHSSNQLNTKLILCGSAAAAAIGYISYVTWKKLICEPDMGQQASSGGYVVEIAPPKLSNGWQLVPQEEEPPPQVKQPPPQTWRITVNPQSSAELVQRVESEEEEEEEEAEEEAEKESTNGKQKFKIKRVTYGAVKEKQKDNQDKNEKIRFPKIQLFACMQGFSGEQFKERLTSTVEGLYGVSKVLNPEEAKCLSLMLELREPHDMLLKTLTTVSNLAAFTTNQDLLREFGALSALKSILAEREHPNAVKVMTVQSIANMAVNATNQLILQDCVPQLVKRLCSSLACELERMVCVQALTNLSLQVTPSHAYHFAKAVPYLYKRLWLHGKVNIAVLKLLINLSCSADLVPYLLAAKAPPGLHTLLNQSQGEDILVRSTSLFTCLCGTVDSLGLTWADLSPLAAESSVLELQSVYFSIFGPLGCSEIPRRLKILKYHSNSEIADKAERIMQVLQNIVISGEYCLSEENHKKETAHF